MKRVVIVLEVGLVTQVLSDVPIQVRIVDYDTDGTPLDELSEVPQGKGEGTVVASVADRNDVQVKAKRVAELFSIPTSG